MATPGLASVSVFNYLGLDPRAHNLPSIIEMRKLLRRLQLLLHPDKARTSADAARAQRLGFNFVVLRAIEEWLDLRGDEESFAKRRRGRADQEREKWVSTWNPHGVEGGAIFQPLPSWTRRSKEKQARFPGHSTRRADWGEPWSLSSAQTYPRSTTRPAYSRRVSTTPQSERRGTYAPANISAFPPSGIPDAPRYDDPTVTLPTELLVWIGCMLSRGHRPCVAIARVCYDEQFGDVAFAELDEAAPFGFLIRFRERGNPMRTIYFDELLTVRAHGEYMAVFGEKGHRFPTIHFMGVFELALKKDEPWLYIQTFLIELEKAQNEYGY